VQKVDRFWEATASGELKPSQNPKKGYGSTSDNFYKVCSGENGAAGPVKIKIDSTILVAE